MAGYILKIMIEDTHPPVWRRVVIPERITFGDLHKIIQIVFGWEDCHLHEFRTPSEDICIDNEEESWGDYHYSEEETPVEMFFPDYKWVRYTYDFGDEWRHKIFYEKTDESYGERYASLLKVKGDNFREDTGGVRMDGEDGWNREKFEPDKTKRRLEAFICPICENTPEDFENKITDIAPEKLEEALAQNLKKYFKRYEKGAFKTPSRMMKKVEAWKEFQEKEKQAPKQSESPRKEYTQLALPFIPEGALDYEGLVIVPGEKTNEELLQDLDKKEAGDYCKYLQIPIQDSWTKNQIVKAVARALREHPEYILYVFSQEEYGEFLQWLKLPFGKIGKRLEGKAVLAKALCLGLADISVQKRKNGERARLSFAKDLQDLLKPLDSNLKKQTYRSLNKVSKKLKNLILVYGVIDFDSLYDMFRKIYHETMDKETLYRYVYWFVSFNGLVETSYLENGTRYASAPQIDAAFVLETQEKYAEGMEYALFSAAEIKKWAEDIAERSDWIDILFTMFHYQFKMPEQAAAQILENVFVGVMNGYALQEVLEYTSVFQRENQNLAGLCELWNCVASLMLELEIPMLKGRSRNEYAKERGVSPWDIDMLEEGKRRNSKECHMSEFPPEIQEAMYRATCFESQQDMKMLFGYQANEHIKSEEFLYLLADAHIEGCEFAKADKLLEKLERSSARGKQAAVSLRHKLETERLAATDEEDEDLYLWNLFESYSESTITPYVRATPKIGRNDPCPCGSGKKYKKCCGKN